MPLGPWLYYYFALLYALIASLSDAYTTSIFLGHPVYGITEGNPVAKWLFNLMGESLATVVVLIFFIWTSALATAANYKAGMIYVGAIAVIETVMALRNFSLIKSVGLA
jgi:hypothetical protein